MKKSIMIVVAVLICQAGWAQEGKREQRIEQKIQHLDSVLQLTDDQEKSIKEILDTNSKKISGIMKEIKVKKEEISGLRKESKDAIEAVLTEDQKALMKEHKLDHKAGKHRMHSSHMEHMKAARAAFDSVLTDDEKATIDRVRSEVRAIRADTTLDQATKRDRIKAASSPLDAIINTHKEELKKVQARHGKKRPKARKRSGKDRKKQMYRFLLLE